MREYRIQASWGGHGVNRNHGYSNATYAEDASQATWLAGYSSSRFQSIAWTFDTAAARQAVAGGAKILDMWFQLRMSRLRAYTSWSLAYKYNDQTDGAAGTFTRAKKTNQSAQYSSYGDYLSLVRTGSYGCTTLEEGSNNDTTPDWLIKIDLSGAEIPLHGFTLGAYNSSTTSRYYTLPTGDISEAVLVIVTDEEEPVPPPPPGPQESGEWHQARALLFDGSAWREVTPVYFDGERWIESPAAMIYGEKIK